MIKLRRLLLSLSLILTFATCKQATDDDSTDTYSNGILSVQTVSYNANTYIFKVRYFVLSANNSNQLIHSETGGLPSLANFSSGITSYTFSCTSVSTLSTPPSGHHSTVLLLDEGKDAPYADAPLREQSSRRFLKTSGDDYGNNFTLAAFASGGLIPHDPVSIFSNGFITNANVFDIPLAQLHDTEFGGTSPVLHALDSIIQYFKGNASPNKNIVLMSTDLDDASPVLEDSLINRAVRNHIRCHIIRNSDSESNDLLLSKIAIKTGGLITPVQYLVGTDLPILSSRLNDILKGNFQCFEATFQMKANRSVFYSGYSLFAYLQLQLNPGQPTYLPFYAQI